MVFYDDVVKKGSEVNREDRKFYVPKGDDVFMLSYTSGTTGNPKGVKLTHKMLLGAANGVQHRSRIDENDSYLSYLPAAHVFEQVTFSISLVYGMKVGFYSGNVMNVTKDLAVLKPTIFLSVPRLLNSVYGKINDKLSKAKGIKKKIIDRGLASKERKLKEGKPLGNRFFDALVFDKIKELFGGRVRIVLSGSAPISNEVLSFLKICFDCDILQGYGLTESSGGTVMTALGDPSLGSIGGPVQNVKIKLRDVPEMGYSHTNEVPSGELCIWSPSVLPGYFKNPEKTQEAKIDGWLLSGDIVTVSPNGAITIVDRLKNIFKLSQGEYIAPEKLENVYIQSEYIQQIWIHGDSMKDWAVAFVVVDTDKAKEYAEANKQPFKIDELLSDKAFVSTVQASMKGLAKENNFANIEMPRKIKLIKDPFTLQQGLLTPTMKFKRNVFTEVFKDDIELLYRK